MHHGTRLHRTGLLAVVPQIPRGLEQDKAIEAELEGKKYAFILDAAYRWSSWAAPRDKDGKLDHNSALTGDDLREIIDHVDDLRFRSQAEKHELSHLYEAKIKNMGNTGRNGGEYYTPRPLIRTMVQVVQSKIGERIYDGTCGSTGFLCEAFDYLCVQPLRHIVIAPQNITNAYRVLT